MTTNPSKQVLKQMLYDDDLDENEDEAEFRQNTDSFEVSLDNFKKRLWVLN